MKDLNLFEVEIITERLHLIPMSSAYNELIFKEFTEKVAVYMYPQPSEDISATIGFVNRCVAALKKGTSLNLVILKKENKEFLGCTGILDIKHKHPQLGIWVKEKAYRNGYGKETIFALVEWAKQHLNYEYLVYPVDKRNVASCKIPIALNAEIGKRYELQNQNGKLLYTLQYWIDRKKN